MSVRLRRRLLFALLVLALTIPAESVLLRALAAPTQADAATQFAATLGTTDLAAAASNIETYPFVYRRAIMSMLSPAARAAAWQGHIAGYLAMHPELDPSSIALLKTTMSLITPNAMAGDGANNARVSAIAVQIQATLGKDVADYLLYRLGPKDPQSANALPIRERLANFVRQHFTVSARADDCDCSTSFGCDAATHCDGGTGCAPDNTWPMCGWFWDQPCDGNCKNGISM